MTYAFWIALNAALIAWGCAADNAPSAALAGVSLGIFLGLAAKRREA
jgi:MYXO-CTERM domain-containing protein